MQTASNARIYQPYPSRPVVNLEEIAKLKESADQFLSLLDCFNDQNDGPTNAVKNANKKIEIYKTHYLPILKDIDSHYQKLLNGQEEIKNQAIKSTINLSIKISRCEKRMQELNDSLDHLRNQTLPPYDKPITPQIIQEIYDKGKLLQTENAKLLNAKNGCLWETLSQVPWLEFVCQKLKMEQEQKRNQTERAYYNAILEVKAEVDKALR